MIAKTLCTYGVPLAFLERLFPHVGEDLDALVRH